MSVRILKSFFGRPGVAEIVVGIFGISTFLTQAFAAPPPNYAIRLTATYHIQLTVSHVMMPDFYPGDCLVTGTVANVFRAPAGTVSVGDKIEVLSQCAVADETGEAGMLADADELSEAQHIEMYLNPGAEMDYEMAGEQYMVIKAPTPEPLCETDKAGITC